MRSLLCGCSVVMYNANLNFHIRYCKLTYYKKNTAAAQTLNCLLAATPIKNFQPYLSPPTGSITPHRYKW